LAKALIVFPGGFGTLDELTEIITLAQTKKIERKIPILLYGESYWNEIINFKALLHHEVINAEDLGLFSFVNDPAEALAHLQRVLTVSAEVETPAFAHSLHADGPSK
jgi:predicted Rossmann-fold nucleotide-binding protein